MALLLSNSNAWVQAAAARALIVWATAESEDALVQLVKADNFMYCRPAIEALATLKTEKAAEAVALQMPRYRGEAGKALKSMGPVAEAATISLLKNTDFWMRRETVGVLAEIGGDGCLASPAGARQGALPDMSSRDMQQAINTIQRRLAASPKGTASPPRHTAKKPADAAPRSSRDARRRRSRDAHVARRLGQVRDRSHARQS